MGITKRTLKTGKNVFDVRVQYGKIRLFKTVPTTISKARLVQSKLIQDLIDGRFEIRKKGNPKFKDYAVEYKNLVSWQKSIRHTSRCLKHLSKYFDEKRLAEITSTNFLEYRAKRLEVVSAATVNRERSCLLRILNLAVKDNNIVISQNPLEGIKKLNEEPAENRILTKKEYHKLLKGAPEYFRRILYFACNTGMRKMEILNLKFSQIRKTPNGFYAELLDTKSGKRENVPLSNGVINLMGTIASEEGIKLDNINQADREKHVFKGLVKNKINDVRRPMERTFSKAGIKIRPFHTFRHFWTQTMFLSGIDPSTIQKIGRWRDFKTMLRYCYTTNLQEHAAVNQLSNYLDD